MATELKRILISDEVDPKCIELFEKNGIQAVKKTKLSKEELIKEIQGYDGLIVRSATKVTKVSCQTPCRQNSRSSCHSLYHSH